MGGRKIQATRILDVPGSEEVWEIGQTLEMLTDRQTRILCYLTFLTAGRISEVLKIRKKDLWVEKVHGIKVPVARMINLKNRKFPIKVVPIFLLNKYDKMMWNEVVKYMVDFHDDQFLFLLKRDTATKRFNKIILKTRYVVEEKGKRKVLEDYEYRLFPHLLRHARLTQLSFLPEIHLTAIAGWTDPRPAEVYIRRDWRRIIENQLAILKGKR